jgi:hypothetical protein
VRYVPHVFAAFRVVCVYTYTCINGKLVKKWRHVMKLGRDGQTSNVEILDSRSFLSRVCMTPPPHTHTQWPCQTACCGRSWAIINEWAAKSLAGWSVPILHLNMKQHLHGVRQSAQACCQHVLLPFAFFSTRFEPSVRCVSSHYHCYITRYGLVPV